ncbi:MAG: alpha-amylase family glycosyl hydrolase, partial [Myxococcota bacterium]
LREGESPLDTMVYFCEAYLRRAINTIHILPFFPYSSDRGFSVMDFEQVNPKLGTWDDIDNLKEDFRLMFDGVFNHVSQHSPWLQEAATDASSPKRAWFELDPDRYEHGFRCWAGVKNLPELQLESESLRDALFRRPDSVVRSYLRDADIDGWRLDVAWELGTSVLRELVSHAHAEKPESVVLGEIWSPPASPTGSWVPPLDGLLSLTLRELVLHWVEGRLPGPYAARVVQRMVEDAGIEALLRSHVIIENHDTPRIRGLLGRAETQAFQLLAAGLPGNLSMLYGMEVGLDGCDDPEMRPPMPWEEAHDDNPVFVWTERLLALRREHRALRVGDFQALDTRELFGFQRATDRYAETVWVFANATSEPVTETVYLRDAKLMNSRLVDLVGGDGFEAHAGFVRVKVPSMSVRLLSHPDHGGWQYNPYKRID